MVGPTSLTLDRLTAARYVPVPLACWVTYIHTQPFNGLWSGTMQVGQYQKKH